MTRSLSLAIALILALTSRAQQTSYTKTPALGVHIAFFDFSGADSLRSFGKNAKPGSPAPSIIGNYRIAKAGNNHSSRELTQ